LIQEKPTLTGKKSALTSFPRARNGTSLDLLAMLLFRARCLLGRLVRLMTTNVTFQISQSNIIVLSHKGKHFQLAITFDHRWPMRSYMQKKKSWRAF
jgi:hypothetical protein